MEITFNIILILGALCGMIMVVGGIWLLRTGAIKLAECGRDAVSLEVRGLFKIVTIYPALGIFVIGLAFILVSSYHARPPQLPTITLRGEALDVDSPVYVDMEPKIVNSDLPYKGIIRHTFNPGHLSIDVRINSPGHQPKVFTFTLADLYGGVDKLGDFTLKPQGEPPEMPDIPPYDERDKFLEGSEIGSFGASS